MSTPCVEHQCQRDDAVGDEHAEVFADGRVAEQVLASQRRHDEQRVEQYAAQQRLPCLLYTSSDSIPTESGVTSSGASVATALMPACVRSVQTASYRCASVRISKCAAALPFVVNDTTISGSSSVLPAFM